MPQHPDSYELNPHWTMGGEFAFHGEVPEPQPEQSMSMRIEKTTTIETTTEIRFIGEDSDLRVFVADNLSFGSVITKVMIIDEPHFGSGWCVRVHDDGTLARTVREAHAKSAPAEFIRVLRDAVAKGARPHPASRPEELRIWEKFLRELAPV